MRLGTQDKPQAHFINNTELNSQEIRLKRKTQPSTILRHSKQENANECSTFVDYIASPRFDANGDCDHKKLTIRTQNF